MNFNANQFKEIYDKWDIDLRELGCVMLDIEPIEMPCDLLDSENLYYSPDPKKFWIKGWVAMEPHCTLLYGLLDKAFEIENEIEVVLGGWKLDKLTIGEFGYFDSPYPDEPYYCIVGHVFISDGLLEGHSRLELLPHINTFPMYKAHITFAYIKKDEILRDKLLEELNRKVGGLSFPIKKINLGERK